MTDKMPRGRTETVTDEELVRAIRNVRGPAVGASEVAEALEEEIGRERSRQRLNRLVDEGLLERKQTGGSNIYWVERPEGS